jgi:hypothetical protein
VREDEGGLFFSLSLSLSLSVVFVWRSLFTAAPSRRACFAINKRTLENKQPHDFDFREEDGAAREREREKRTSPLRLLSTTALFFSPPALSTTNCSLPLLPTCKIFFLPEGFFLSPADDVSSVFFFFTPEAAP